MGTTGFRQLSLSVYGFHLGRKSKRTWDKVLRSNFNSRGVNSREIGRFFGHNSEPARS